MAFLRGVPVVDGIFWAATGLILLIGAFVIRGAYRLSVVPNPFGGRGFFMPEEFGKRSGSAMVSLFLLWLCPVSLEIAVLVERHGWLSGARQWWLLDGLAVYFALRVAMSIFICVVVLVVQHKLPPMSKWTFVGWGVVILFILGMSVNSW